MRFVARLPSKPKEIEVAGIKFSSYAEACRHFNIDKYVFNARINYYGWSILQSLEVEKRPGYEKGIVGLVYLVKHINSMKPYVGITMGTLDERWGQHVDKAMSDKQLNHDSLHFSIRKDGANAFSQEIIAKASSPGELSDLEKKYVTQYDSLAPNGYNLNKGGGGTRTKGKTIFVDGVKYKSYAEVAKKYGCNRRLLNERISSGWTPEEAVGLVEKEGLKKPVELTVEGVKYESIKKAADQYKLNRNRVAAMLKEGKSIEEIFRLGKYSDPIQLDLPW